MINKRKLVRHGYNQIARVYAQSRDRFDNYDLLKNLTARLEPEARILDLGCGTGIPVCKYFIDNGFVVTGIDLSSEMLKLACANLPDADFIEMDMTELRFEKRAFDAVTAFYSIFHVERTQHPQLFSDIHDILKPNGFILIGLGNERWEGVEDFHGVDMFWSHYDPDHYNQLLFQIGFRIEHNQIIAENDERHYWVIARKI
jgi:ubiquinone/menaquinone biosynthesis C-methylase UbiE